MTSPADWQPAAGIDLEPGARTAATSQEGNLLIIAGPGSGKTELLAQRADFLLTTEVCRYPKRILAISFKVDAARNLEQRVRRRCSPALASRLDSHTFHAFAKRVIDTFRPVLTGADALDPDYTVGTTAIAGSQITFAQMAPLATKILKGSVIARNAIDQTYEFVFLDEFQDCTQDQYALLLAAFGTRTDGLIAVGDAKQRIMMWAGALPRVMSAYKETFDATPIPLLQNYRAKPRLRRMQNTMILDLEPESAIGADQLLGDAGSVQVQRFVDDTDEAAWVADQIQEWIDDDGISPEEIAVLVRSSLPLYTPQLCKRLRELQIPFRLEADSQDLPGEPIAGLICDYLAVVCGDQEADAYTRLMDVARSGATNQADEQGRFLALRESVESSREKLQLIGEQSVRDLVGELRQVVGVSVLASMAPAYQQAERLEEIVEQVVASLEELVEATGDVAAALREFVGTGAVRILTVHKSKGLEYDAVVVLGVERELYFGEDVDETFFVAISRPREHLVLTVCGQREPESAPWWWKRRRSEFSRLTAYAESAL
ncbi:ATP-dependent helicase [Cellulomonas hominis]|uniref:DNA 3'-5' helicase n=1 Tax=Cellulomonas hominis TaxID=156981 RepID=A0A7Z8K387_9CELL|nr:ATP-dependent helicase [Cellulomonas hominis]TKR27004.1 ATP-dependent helicase [Cellulomonas hominis]